MSTLDERMGGQRSFRNSRAGDNPDRLAWGRIIGLTGSRDGGELGIYGDKGPSYDYDLLALQTGVDLYRAEHEDGSFDNAGFYLAFGRTEADVAHFDGMDAGTDSLDGYTVGGYWTHFGAGGWYLDGVVQGTWYDVKASGRLPSMDASGFGFGASLEGGYPFDLGNGFVLEPQAQLSYQAIDLRDTHDIGAEVGFNDVESLLGRLGRTALTDLGSDASGHIQRRPTEGSGVAQGKSHQRIPPRARYALLIGKRSSAVPGRHEGCGDQDRRRL